MEVDGAKPGIRGMDRAAIEKARSRLRIARKALNVMKTCRSFSDFSDNWYVVLTSSKAVYTVLEQGAKISPQSRQWFGSKNQIRKDDPLLQYMFEARNDDEHGLGSAVELRPGRTDIGAAGNGFSNAVRLDGGPFSNFVSINCGTAVSFEGGLPPSDLRATPLDGKPVRVLRTPETTALIPISARGNRIINPPNHHLGNPLQDTSPIAVAELNLTYLEGLIAEVNGLV